MGPVRAAGRWLLADDVPGLLVSSSLHDPLSTDSTGAWNGDPSLSHSDPVNDSYGYQEIGGNGTYDPNLASDGTDLTSVPVVVAAPNAGCENTDDDGDWDVKLNSSGNPIEGWSWLTVGEQHAYWNATAWYLYTKGAQTTYSVMTSETGGAFTLGYNASYSSGASWSTGITRGGMASYLNVLATNFADVTETLHCPHGLGNHTYGKIIRTGIHEEPSNPNWDP